jgi:beta-lactamase superfamily II metal-dependent hydrolase
MKNSSNDAGVVSRLVFGENSFLFTGDLSSKGEKLLINSGENIVSDVLKVGHHGSKYSTSDLFLENVQPLPEAVESVKVGSQTYTRPANFTDTQWSAYKQSMGAK